MFKTSPIHQDDIARMKKCGVLTSNPVIHPNRLMKLDLSYIDFEGNVHHDGKMMVLDVVAPNVLTIFRTLFIMKFPLHSIKLMEDFLGDDHASMVANNTSAFCDRSVTGASGNPSLHAYGLAFDINPVQNPYILEGDILPSSGRNHLDRSQIMPGYAETIVDLCKTNGFEIWGGHWTEPKDFQHFQTSREYAEKCR